jgi:hypothetical protein
VNVLRNEARRGIAVDRLRSALFLDFDNIFGGLLAVDRQAALRLATEPLVLLERLSTHGMGSAAYRDLLVRRAYLNPHGVIYDEEFGNESNRLYLQRYRPNLTRAGFEVIDCPALTSRQKNAADIRIVIDVLTALDEATHYDEVLIASGDADFTPLLQRIRARDRRTTVITAGPAAPAYKAVAHEYLDEEALIDLLGVTETAPDLDTLEGAEPQRAATDRMDPDTARATAVDLLNRYAGEADAAVLLADVGHLIHREVGTAVIRDTNWFGAGSLSGFVAAATDGALRSEGHYVWDPQRHAEPDAAMTSMSLVELPPIIHQVCRITDMPRLPSDGWSALFAALADYAATETFNLTQATAWVRDRLADAGTPVGRQSISFVMRGMMYGGVRLDDKPPPTSNEVRHGFAESIVARAQAAGLELSESDRAVLSDWLAGKPPRDQAAYT